MSFLYLLLDCQMCQSDMTHGQFMQRLRVYLWKLETSNARMNASLSSYSESIQHKVIAKYRIHQFLCQYFVQGFQFIISSMEERNPIVFPISLRVFILKDSLSKLCSHTKKKSLATNRYSQSLLKTDSLCSDLLLCLQLNASQNSSHFKLHLQALKGSHDILFSILDNCSLYEPV